MQYWVIAQDGQKYGPADIATINTWVAQNRIHGDTILQDVATGEQMQASQVPGILFSGEQTQPSYQTYQNQYQNQQYQNQYFNQNQGTNYPRIPNQVNDQDVSNAWILGVVGLLCCPIVAIFGVIKASNAQRYGHPKAQGALIFNIIVLVISCGVWPLFSGIFQGIFR